MVAQDNRSIMHPVHIVQGVSNAHCAYRSKAQRFNCINDGVATEDEYVDLIKKNIERQLENFHFYYLVYAKILEEYSKLKGPKKVFEKYIEYQEVRNVILQMYLENGEYEKAVNLAQSLEDQLMIHRKIGTEQEIKETLKKLVLTYGGTNLDYYNEYKTFFSEKQWMKEREQITENLDESKLVHLIYEKEDMNDELMELILEQDGFELLDCYIDRLKKDYSQAILTKYANEINKLVRYKYNNNRIVSRLFEMLKIEGGKELAEILFSYWEEEYPKRTWLMDIIDYVRSEYQ